MQTSNFCYCTLQIACSFIYLFIFHARIHTFISVEFSMSLVLLKMNYCNGNGGNTEDVNLQGSLM